MGSQPQVNPRLGLKLLSIIFLVVGFFVVVDVSISSLVDIYHKFSSSSSGMQLFVATTMVLFSGTYVILKFTEKKLNMQKKNENDNLIVKIIWSIYYLMVAINVFIIFELLIYQAYHTRLLSIASAISYGFGSIILGLLAYHFLTWFRKNKSLVVLLYGLASISASAYVAILPMIFYVEIIYHQPEVTTSKSIIIFPGFEEGTYEEILIFTIPYYLTATTFLLFWGGTICILYSNIRRIGKTRFWILVTPPIVFILWTLISIFPELQGGTPLIDPNSIEVPIYINNSSQILAIALFAVGFVSIARAIKHHQISDFMYIASFGLALFSISIIATVSGAGYPPSGLPTVSLVGPFSFLLYIGLHRSAISTAQDSNLRRNIKVSTQQQLGLLKSIGTAEMQQKLEKNILEVTRLKAVDLVQQSGVEPTISMDETRQFIYEALEEVKKLKR